jgi:hypothetical protein
MGAGTVRDSGKPSTFKSPDGTGHLNTRVSRTRLTREPDEQNSTPGTSTDNYMHESNFFASSCPRCRRQQPQRGFSRAALLILLSAGAAPTPARRSKAGAHHERCSNHR